MPIFYLTDEILFPPVSYAEEDGLLAVGGDLSPERLLEAYRRGIFPWFSERQPILWWSPDPRFIVHPGSVYISKSMRQILTRGIFDITFDMAFQDVIRACRMTRRHSTWITEEMIEAYTTLHELGFAHSVEAWKDGALAGGLYGISLGSAFFGESMFTRVSNASKAAFITLALNLRDLGFSMIDCQVYTDHLASLGAFYVPRSEFIKILKESLKRETIKGNWMETGLFKTSFTKEEFKKQVS